MKTKQEKTNMKQSYWKYYMRNTTAVVLNEFDRPVSVISAELLAAIQEHETVYAMTANDHNALLEVLSIEGELQ